MQMSPIRKRERAPDNVRGSFWKRTAKSRLEPQSPLFLSDELEHLHADFIQNSPDRTPADVHRALTRQAASLSRRPVLKAGTATQSRGRSCNRHLAALGASRYRLPGVWL